jgi:hypothetical protein
VAIFGALALLFVVGTRWVRRGRASVAVEAAAGAAAAPTEQDEEYAEKLDDELRDID